MTKQPEPRHITLAYLMQKYHGHLLPPIIPQVEEADKQVSRFGAALGRYYSAVECASLDEIERQAMIDAALEGE